MSEKIYLPGESYQYPLIIKKLLLTPLTWAPDQEIVYRDSVRYTYRELNERIHGLAGGLENYGVEPGDTVAVLDYDSHRYLECFFAIPMMGCVLQMVNWRLSPEQIAYTINHAGAKTIIVHVDFLPLLRKIYDSLTKVIKIFVISEDGSLPVTSILYSGLYEGLINGAPARYEFPDLDENTRATVFYTTGTTGKPKGVHFTHRQLVLHTMSAALAAGSYETIGRFRSNDVYMPITPMFHVHAWGMPYVATLLGVKQVYPGKYEPDMLLKLIVGESVTFSHCVPTILQMIVTSPAVKGIDLSAWKVVIGGSKLSKGLAGAAAERGITVYTGYGMSETCPIISLSLPKDYMMEWEEDKKIDIAIKTGLPIPLVEVEIVDGMGNPLPRDGQTTGEVVVRAPWLTDYYIRAPGRTEELWQNGWLHTGDVGHIDKEGYIEVTDRMKDVIKSGGEWISSLDLEDLLSQNAVILESAAIGIPDDKWGERPIMVVALKPEYRDKITEKELKNHMENFARAGKLPGYGVPDRYEFVDELAKTSVGKVDKKLLRKMFK